MSPEIIKRKLSLIAKYIDDLKKYENCSFEEFMQNHYEIERLIELLIEVSIDIIFHIIAEKDEPPPLSYRAGFLRAGELGIISNPLAVSLSKASGLRNILIHEYEEIDYNLLHQSVNLAIRDFSNFIGELSK